MSTLEKDNNAYHHGDLRNTLIQLGTEMLAESGETGLSLRKLAKRAGVSHNAPYQHFADKNALIAAIAEEGFHMLAAAVEGADASGDVVERLTAVGHAYVQFALDHTAHMQVMFGTFPNSEYPSLAQASIGALDKLVAVIATLDAAGDLQPEDTHDAALTVWMALHGLSSILVIDKVPDAIRRGRDDAALTDQFVRILCGGLLKGTSA